MDVNRIRVILTLLQSYKGMRGNYGQVNFSSITSPRFEPPQLINKLLSSVTNPFPFETHIYSDNWIEINSKVSSFVKEFNFTNIRVKLISDITDVPFSLTAGPNSNTSFLGSLWDSLGNMYKNPSLKEYAKLSYKYHQE